MKYNYSFYFKNLNFIFFLTNIILLLGYLFIGEFNYLKAAIFFLLILNLIFFYFNFFIKKEELVSRYENFYVELDNFFNLLTTPFVIYDDQMKIVYVNDAFAKLVALDKNKLLNLKLETWLTKNQQYFKLALIFFPSLSSDHLKIIQTDNPNIIEISYQDNLFWLIISSKISYQQKVYNFKIIVDRSKDYYYDQQSIEFLNLLAHHLRNPLNQIKWLLETLRNDNNKESINEALSILDKTLILSQTILLINKVENNKIKLEIENNNLQNLFNECLSFFKYYLKEKEIKTEIYLEDTVRNFYFDKNIIFFIIFSLIENAIDYNQPKGKIVIRVEKDTGRDYVKIQISDTGIGMNDDEIKNIFKKYYRSQEAKKNKPTGFGLGLYLVYQLIKIHKGEIKVESKKNIGTNFILFLPLNREIYT